MAQSSERMRIEPPPTTLLNLNDDVLRETFEKLDDYDLLAVANVCANFRRNAQDVFSLRYKRKSFKFISGNFNKLPAMLRNIGSVLTSLDVHIDTITGNSKQIMKTIVQYCGEKLVELKLYGIHLDAEIIQIMEPLLRRLQKMDLAPCSYDVNFNVSEMYGLCTELQSLALSDSLVNAGCVHSDLLIHFNIPKLKSLQIGYSRSIESIENFLKANPQLKELEFQPFRGLPSTMFASIVKYTPHLEKLNFVFFHQQHARQLKQLTSLKWLEIICAGLSYSPLIAELVASRVQLKCLRLVSHKADKELFIAISKLNQLKTLDFSTADAVNASDFVEMVRCLSELVDLRITSDEITASHILDIIRSAPNLDYFQISTSEPFGMTVKAYMEILDVVASRNGHRRLDIRLENGSVNAPQDLVKANRNLLKIHTEDAYDERPYAV